MTEGVHDIVSGNRIDPDDYRTELTTDEMNELDERVAPLLDALVAAADEHASTNPAT